MKNENLKMVVVLPNAIDGLPLVEANVDKLTPAYLMENTDPPNQEVILYLPKFKVESTIELKDPLQKVTNLIVESSKSQNYFLIDKTLIAIIRWAWWICFLIKQILAE